MSQPSLGGIGDRDEECTPPVSPIFVSEVTSGAATSAAKPKQGLFTQKSAPTFSRKYQDSSLDADDTESELVAIPESDMSESTIHNSSAPGSFDDPPSATQFTSGEGPLRLSRDAAKGGDEYHIEEMVQPLRSEQLKGKVTTANLATAQVALTTLGVAERERTEEVHTGFNLCIRCISNFYLSPNETQQKSETKKTSRMFMKLNSLDKSHDKMVQKTIGNSVDSSSRIVTKCSVQEGVRMMVTPSMFMTGQSTIEKAVINPPVTIQRAVVVSQTQDSSIEAKLNNVSDGSDAKQEMIDTSEVDSAASRPGPSSCLLATMIAETPTSVAKQIVIGAVPGTRQNGSNIEATTPMPRTLGRQKRIVEATVFDKIIQPTLKTIEKITEFGSPDSPLSKMNVMPNPLPNAMQRNLDGQLSSSSATKRQIPQLEFPTPERLLPIGQHSKDAATTLADKVREVLSTTDISHLKQESSFERSEVRHRTFSSIFHNMVNEFFLQSTGNDITHSSQTNSPRRLTKQIALESPSTDLHPNASHAMPRDRLTATSYMTNASRKDEPMTSNQQRQRLRKIGPFAVDSQSIPDSRTKYAGSWPPPCYESDSEIGNTSSKPNDPKPPNTNKEEKICHRCSECGAALEEYNDEEIGIMIIILNTFIHREPALAAAFLPEILTTVSK